MALATREASISVTGVRDEEVEGNEVEGNEMEGNEKSVVF